jgi:hypothetical protein
MTAGIAICGARHRLCAGAAVLSSALALGLIVSSAAAQPPYFQGKEIEITVPFAEGGATDVSARFLAPYFEKHIAGNPRITVRNRPGGGSILGANWFEMNANPDGTSWFMTTSSSTHPFLFQMDEVEYNLLNKRVPFAMPWGSIFYTSPDTGITEASQLFEPQAPLIYGGIAAQASDLPWLLAFEVLKLEPTVVLGFTGRGPTRLAFERGEINFEWQATPVYMTQVVPMVEEGRAIPLLTGGFPDENDQMTQRDLVMTDLPSVYEVHEMLYGEPPSGVEWEAFQRIAALAWQFGLPVFLHEDTPDEAVEAIIEAVHAINEDPEFQEEAQRVTGGYPLTPGDEVEPKLKANLEPGGEVYDYIINLLATKYDVQL